MGFACRDICDEIRADDMALYCKSLARRGAFGHSVFVIYRRPTILAVAHAIVARISGPEAADTFLMDAMTWTWIAVLVLVPAGLIGYGAVCLARRFLGKRA